MEAWKVFFVLNAYIYQVIYPTRIHEEQFLLFCSRVYSIYHLNIKKLLSELQIEGYKKLQKIVETSPLNIIDQIVNENYNSDQFTLWWNRLYRVIDDSFTEAAQVQYKLSIGYHSQPILKLLLSNTNNIKSATKKVFIARLRENIKRIEREKKRQKTFSKRMLQDSYRFCQVVYPSGKKMEAHFKKKNDLVLIEPQVPNCAYFIIPEKEWLKKSEINLNQIEFRRVTHHERGNGEIKALFYD